MGCTPTGVCVVHVQFVAPWAFSEGDGSEKRNQPLQVSLLSPVFSTSFLSKRSFQVGPSRIDTKSVLSWQTSKNPETPSEASSIREHSPATLQLPQVTSILAPADRATPLETVPEDAEDRTPSDEGQVTAEDVLSGMLSADGVHSHEGNEVVSPISASDYLSIITLPSFVHDRSNSSSSSRALQHTPTTPGPAMHASRRSVLWSLEAIPPVPSISPSLATGVTGPGSPSSGSRERGFPFPGLSKNFMRVSLPSSSKRGSSSSSDLKDPSSKKRRSDSSTRKGSAPADARNVSGIEAESQWTKLRPSLGGRTFREGGGGGIDPDSRLPSYTTNVVQSPEPLAFALPQPPSPSPSHVTSSSDLYYQPAVPHSPASATHVRLSPVPTLDLDEKNFDDASPPVYRAKETPMQSGFAPQPTLRPLPLPVDMLQSTLSRSATMSTLATYPVISNTQFQSTSSFFLSAESGLYSQGTSFTNTPTRGVRPLPVLPPLSDSRPTEPSHLRSQSSSTGRALPTVPIPNRNPEL